MYSIYWISAHYHIDPYSEGYVGMSNQPEKRFKAHTTDTAGVGSKVVRAYVEEHGLNSVKHTILGTRETLEEAQELEKTYRPNHSIGWNLAKGGGTNPNCKGRKPSEETKDKISATNIATRAGRIYQSHFKGVSDRWSEEQKEKIGQAQRGKTISEEHKQSAREKLSRDKSPRAVALKIRNIHTGEIREYGSIGNASDALSVPYSTVRAARQRKHLMCKTWEFLD